jgi:PPM family protein phosphatase
MNEIENITEHLSEWLLRRTNVTAVRRVADLPISIGTDIGIARTDNQDRIGVLRFCDQSGKTQIIVALSDGMGGLDAGAICASKAIASFFSYSIFNSHLSGEEQVLSAAQFADETVYREFKGEGGATLSALMFKEGRDPIGINIGDSRIYTSNGNGLIQRSIDDTLEAHAKGPGALDNVWSNQLLQFVGMGSELEPHLIALDPVPQTIYLTSDGIHAGHQQTISRVVNVATDSGLAIKRLLELARWTGGKDNATMAAITTLDVDSFLWPHANDFQVYDPFNEIRLIFHHHHVQTGEILNIHEQEDPTPQEAETTKKQRKKKSRKKVEPNSEPQNDADALSKDLPQLDIEFASKE